MRVEGKGGKEWREKGVVNKKGVVHVLFSEVLMTVNHAVDLKIFVALKLLESPFKLSFLTIAFEMHFPLKYRFEL